MNGTKPLSPRLSSLISSHQSNTQNKQDNARKLGVAAVWGKASVNAHPLGQKGNTPSNAQRFYLLKLLQMGRIRIPPYAQAIFLAIIY